MPAKTIMVTSGKGGVGKSSVCAGIGYHLAVLGGKVLILEMDSGLRCLDLMLGVGENTVFDIADVLCGRCEPIKAIYSSPLAQGLSVMPATFRPNSDYESALFDKLCRGLSHYYDYLLIETPAGFGRTLNDIARVSGQALLVVTPDPISMRDARILSDYLDERGLLPQHVVINKVRAPRGRLEGLTDLDVVIDTVCEPLIGVIPYEPEMVRALPQGRMLPVSCLAGQALCNIARRLTGEFVELAVM